MKKTTKEPATEKLNIPEPNVLSITTGDVNYAIKNEFGEEIGSIRFNPADIDIVRRCEAVEQWFRNFSIPSEPSLDDVYHATDKIKMQFDYMLNRNVSGEIFKVCNPLTVLADGSYFYVGVLDAIISIIAKVMRERTEKSIKRVEEAVAELTENE